MQNNIGRFKHKVNASLSYQQLSVSDENAAIILYENGAYRQSCYYTLQAMEKVIRAKIFTLVDANNSYFRERNRSHSVEDAVSFLLEVISSNETVKSQINHQLKEHVLGITKYNFLHNNLRYPSFFQKYDSYSLLEVGKEDAGDLLNRLKLLKSFIQDIDVIANT
ncbi:HEPN domain-containing protein [Vibrio sp. 1159]|uniref:HEPN domain-containing protein n=1 Tax=Vibrio sp. 1159 TaxID=3074545 RepID=UPI002964BFE1|nr:HEPN domain-containing protein [Vibrio sp. 1159]MDW2320146.1 HEPN domain-containing protein [Vibrio sp. 1159]